jgi:hypothetical protein
MGAAPGDCGYADTAILGMRNSTGPREDTVEHLNGERIDFCVQG